MLPRTNDIKPSRNSIEAFISVSARYPPAPVAPTQQLTDDGRLKVDKHGARHVLAAAGLSEEGAEAVVAHRLVGRHLAIGLDAVLEAVQLPAGIAHLHARLAHMDRDALALKQRQSPG